MRLKKLLMLGAAVTLIEGTSATALAAETTQSVTNETVTEELSAAGETSVVSEILEVDKTPTVAETLVTDETSTVPETFEEDETAAETLATDETAEEETSATDATAAEEETSVTDEKPAEEETSTTDEAPTIAETSAADETPAVPETTEEDETPEVSETTAADETEEDEIDITYYIIEPSVSEVVFDGKNDITFDITLTRRWDIPTADEMLDNTLKISGVPLSNDGMVSGVIFDQVNEGRVTKVSITIPADSLKTWFDANGIQNGTVMNMTYTTLPVWGDGLVSCDLPLRIAYENTDDSQNPDGSTGNNGDSGNNVGNNSGSGQNGEMNNGNQTTDSETNHTGASPETGDMMPVIPLAGTAITSLGIAAREILRKFRK